MGWFVVLLVTFWMTVSFLALRSDKTTTTRFAHATCWSGAHKIYDSIAKDPSERLIQGKFMRPEYKFTDAVTGQTITTDADCVIAEMK